MTDEMLQTKLGDLAGALGKLKSNPKSVDAREEIRKTLNEIFIDPKQMRHNKDVVRCISYACYDSR